MSFLRSKRGLWIAAIALILAMFLVRPGANSLRTRIVSSISLALGRPVDVSSVSVQLLPQPGFDLENFVVHEDPAFGSEPMLRAQEVTATLRVTSLLRGRIEIARLTLTGPSLNLVQDSTGHWNLENLLERAARTPVAPTSKRKTEARPGFPYIEADRGRINFKLGQEKKPYALTEADFAIWQDSENAWGMRLKAHPVRTDFNLSDTGTLRLNGSWQRAASLRETPLQFNMQWERAQLGQVTKLARGRDLGWRGTIQLSATLAGMPADLLVATNVSIDDFRRYDLPAGGALHLAAGCSAHYSSIDHTFPSLSCTAPVGLGAVTLSGNVAGSAGSRTYDLSLLARAVPMQSLVSLARHAKKDIPDDLLASGTLDAAFKFQRKNQPHQSITAWSGAGQTRGFAIASFANKTSLIFDKIPFALGTGKKHANDAAAGENLRIPSDLEVGPFNIGLGRPGPAVLRATLSPSDYRLLIRGDAQIQRLLQLARTIGLPTIQPAADGVAKMDLQVAGAWSAFSLPKAVGTAQLHSVHAEVHGLNSPLEIASANLVLSPDQVSVQNLAASIAGSTWHGSLEIPRPCIVPADCLVHFDLHTDSLATDDLSALLSPGPRQRPWYRLLSATPRSGGTYLFSLHASGQLTASRVAIRRLQATKASANVDWEHGVLRLSDLRGDVLGGKHIGEWKADFHVSPPVYAGKGEIRKIALGQLAQTMHDDWITGTAAVKYNATASGLTADDLLSSANATLQVESLDGTLPHLTLANGDGPLQVRSLTARLLLSDGVFEIWEGKLDTPGGIYQVSGTASLGRDLNVKLMRDSAHGFNITGTVTEPRVAEAAPPETQAALKP